jgi:hypothetical protein
VPGAPGAHPGQDLLHESHRGQVVHLEIRPRLLDRGLFDPAEAFTGLIDFGDAYASHPMLDLRSWPDPAPGPTR